MWWGVFGRQALGLAKKGFRVDGRFRNPTKLTCYEWNPVKTWRYSQYKLVFADFWTINSMSLFLRVHFVYPQMGFQRFPAATSSFGETTTGQQCWWRSRIFSPSLLGFLHITQRAQKDNHLKLLLMFTWLNFLNYWWQQNWWYLYLLVWFPNNHLCCCQSHGRNKPILSKNSREKIHHGTPHEGAIRRSSRTFSRTVQGRCCIHKKPKLRCDWVWIFHPLRYLREILFIPPSWESIVL